MTRRQYLHRIRSPTFFCSPSAGRFAIPEVYCILPTMMSTSLDASHGTPPRPRLLDPTWPNIEYHNDMWCSND